MNDLTTAPPGGDDDGFSGSSGRGHDFLRWNAENGWLDRDGVAAPSPLLAMKVDEILRRWTDNIPEDITKKPLPDPEELNAAIPVSEWEIGLDGKPRPPWAHYVVVYLVNPSTATKYVYAAATAGGHIAVEQLKENVITMRMLRGARVMPLVELSSKPMKTKYKKTGDRRPDFQILSWHLPGGDGGVLAAPTTPQLTGPTAAPVTPEPQPPQPSKPSEPKEDPTSSGPLPQTKAKPKRPVTLDDMLDVKPATSSEILDDDIPW
jgi:hypothetical protein